MDMVLQVWGGAFYLLNKVFFALAEGKREEAKRTLRIIGWVVYLLGVPAWVIILVGKHNWIAASIEAGGIPAMLFGLYNVCKGPGPIRKDFDRVTSFFTYAALLLGVCYSVYDYGGLSTITQLLEIGVMVGFLMGSYLLAKKNFNGWLFFVLMNGSMASLMFLQHKPVLAIQQLASLCFVLYGFTMAFKSVKRGGESI